jgi:hypothetical protein
MGKSRLDGPVPVWSDDVFLLGSCNIMGNTATLKITKGKDKIKYV